MNRSLSALLVTAALAGGGTAVVAVADPAGAAGRSCTAWATLPARVALAAPQTTIRPRLVGTSGCRADTFDGGATATLHSPGQDPYAQRWAKFGNREEISLYPSLDSTGRLSVRDGHVQVYDADEVRVPATWRATSTTVKYGARFVAVSTSSTGARATLKHYTEDGWRPSARSTVALQKHTGHGWTTVARARTGAHGGVGFTHAASGQYRLVSAGTSTVWNSVAWLGNRA